MRTTALGLCLSGFLFSAFQAQAATEYSIKSESAGLFRTLTLEPPPLATLQKGEALKLLHRGEAQSLVETFGGLKGWVRNQDLLAIESGPGKKFTLPGQSVTGGGEVAISPDSWGMAPAKLEVSDLERSFSGEIVESADKEQVEMRHDEN